MTQFKSKAALLMLLVVPCRAFGGLSDVAGSLVELPVNMVRSAVNMSMEIVDGVAKIESTTFDLAMKYPMDGVKAVMSLAEEHSQTLWRVASVATMVCAFKYAKQAYMKNCPMACKK